MRKITENRKKHTTNDNNDDANCKRVLLYWTAEWNGKNL